jgi:adenosylmethionine-8-amino-7-oxononanoate aminotransferase
MDNWKDLDRQHIWHPFTSLAADDANIFIERAKGIYLHTSDGRKIIDAISSWWVNLHGHSNPTIAQAIATQAQTLEHVIFAGFTHRPAIELSENLLSVLPWNQRKIFFSDNGSTAVEVGLKMALQYWYNQGIKHKRKVIALEGGYHGDTFGSMSVGDRGAFTTPFQPYLFEVDFLPFPTADNEEIVVDKFTNLVKGGDVAAFIFEPLVQASGGMRMYSKDTLQQLIYTAHSHGVVTLADEVFTGFGRTGKLFASDYMEEKPDIIALSKGITGGSLPLGVTSCSEKIQKAFQDADIHKTFYHGHSYTANPIVCAAANASFGLLMQEQCQEQIVAIAKSHNKFREHIAAHKNVQDVRSLGTILAIELKTSSGTSYFNNIRKRISPYFLQRDILLRPLGNVIYVLPPYIIRQDELHEIYRHIENFLTHECD